MRDFVYVLAATGLLGAAACAGEPGPCSTPTGCVSAARVDGACSCVEWQTVSSREIALSYVVLGVWYRPVGTASVFRYGTTGGASTEPRAASVLGTTLRAVVRRSNGSEQTARLGSIRTYGVTALGEAAVHVGDGSTWTLTTPVDLPAPESDEIMVWANPVVTLVTDYVGEKTVHWSHAPLCLSTGLDCDAPQYLALSTALLQGGAADSTDDGYLAALGPAGRAALLAFAPRDDGAALQWPRYQRLAEVGVGESPRSVDAAWQPCRAPGSFEVLAETAVPAGDGDTLVLQYAAHPDSACAPQRPGLVVGTATPGCSFHATVFVDRLSGTLVMQPSMATVACTAAR